MTERISNHYQFLLEAIQIIYYLFQINSLIKNYIKMKFVAVIVIVTFFAFQVNYNLKINYYYLLNFISNYFQIVFRLHSHLGPVQIRIVLATWLIVLGLK